MQLQLLFPSILDKCIAQQCQPWMYEANPVYLEMTITLVKPSDPGNKENEENKAECSATPPDAAPAPIVLFFWLCKKFILPSLSQAPS